jgi:hypothetical protein
MTVKVVTDKDGRIMDAAPIVSRFVGQQLGRLIEWMKCQGKVRIERLRCQSGVRSTLL